MLILAVDTSTRSGSLALLRDETLLGTVAAQPQEPHSSGIFRDLSALLQQTKLELSQVDLFAVACGPGSFTGLRVGLTVVKAWAELFQKRIARVSTLEAIAAQSQSSVPLLAAFFAAGRGQVFGAVYSRDTERLVLQGEQAVFSPEEFVESLSLKRQGQFAHLVSSSPDVLSPALNNSVLKGSLVEPVSAVLAPTIGKLGYSRALHSEVVDACTLDANYVRRSDAEAHWKGPASKTSRA